MANIIAKINCRTTGTAASNTFGTWTDLNSVTAAATVNILNFSGGADTGWDVTIEDAPVGQDTTGVNAVGTGDADWVDEAVCSQWSHYTTTANGQATYSITGLNNANTYNISAFPSTADAGVISYSVDAYATSQGINQAANNTLIAEFLAVSPVLGEILLSFKTSTSNFAQNSAIQIEEVSTGGSITSVGGDDVVLDAETPAFVTTGFTSEISTVQLISGSSITNGSSVSSASGTGTFVLPDITLYTGDVIGCPLTTANNIVVARLTDA